MASIVCCHLEVAVGRLSKFHAWKGCPEKARPPSKSGSRAVELRRFPGISRPSSTIPKGEPEAKGVTGCPKGAQRPAGLGLGQLVTSRAAGLPHATDSRREPWRKPRPGSRLG